MNFKIKKEVLYNGLGVVSKAAAVRGIQPVLSNVLIEAEENNLLKLCATDLDLSIEIKIPANVIKTGSITLPAKKLLEIISKLPTDEEVVFNINEENNLTEIKCGKSKFDIKGISFTEFPVIDRPESDECVDIKINTLLKAVKQTVFSTAGYDTNNVLGGVLFKINGDTLEMAATDGNRLAIIKEKIENNENKTCTAIIPSRTLKEVIGVLTGAEDEKTSITVKNGQILIKLNDRYITSRLIEGQYPSYEQLIPKNYEIKAVMDKNIFNQVLDRVSTMANERTSIVKLNLNSNKIKLAADTPDLGDCFDEIDAEYNSEEINIAFNYRYIQDFLKVVDSEKVVIELNGQLAGALFKPFNEENKEINDFLCLIMPVQIN